MSAWTIVEKDNQTFAALGLANLRRSLVSQAVDTVIFDAPGADFDGTALFSYGDTVTIQKDGVTWFQGRVTTLPRQGTPTSERIAYELAGPWWYLEKTVYQNYWLLWSAADGGVIPQYKSRLILGQDVNGNRITTGVQIADAVSYAIDKGALLQLGTVDPDLSMPFDECTDLTCAEVINRLLRFTPDCVCWFDYTTLPYPTFHCRKRANLSAVSYSAISGAPVNEIQITPRYDLQVPGVIIIFEQTNVDNETTWESTTIQTAGTLTAYDVLVATIELAGSRRQSLSQKIVTENFPDDLDDETWWKSHVPWLKDANAAKTRFVRNLSIHDTERLGVLPRILAEGTVQEWMNKSTEDDEITGLIDFDIFDAAEGGNLIASIKDRVETFAVVATDATTRTYSKLVEMTSAESIPSGMAAVLYAAWSQLQYDGHVVLVENECTGAVLPGRSLNLTGGIAAWTTMAALVQRIEEHIDGGRTVITFGPAKHIAPEDLMTLLRGFRTRRTSLGYSVRSTGATDDAVPEIPLAGPVAKNQPAAGAGETTAMYMRSGTSPDTKQISLDPTLIPETGKEIKPRVLTVCVDGVAKSIIFLCSEAY